MLWKMSPAILNMSPETGGEMESDKRYQQFLYVCFLICAFGTILFPGPGKIAKYVMIPVLMALMFRKPIFDDLLFPLTFLDNPIGTMFFGKITMLWIYLALLLAKYFLNGDFRIKKRSFLILCICSVYFLIRIRQYQMSAIKMLLVVLSTMLMSNLYEDEPERLELLLFSIYTAALLQGISLSIGLTGTIEAAERTTGIGFSDPNYASFICVCGFCALSNAQRKRTFDKVFCVLGCLLLVFGIFRSGSRSGFLVVTGVFLINLILLRGTKKKLRYLIIVLLIAAAFLYLTTVGVIRIPNLDKLLARWFSLFDSLKAKNYDSATTHRSKLLGYYWDYYVHQDLFHVLFGGNVMGSDSMLSVGHGKVTHNVYLDYLLTFGLVFSVVLFSFYVRRILRYYLAYRETGKGAYLGVAEIKLSALMMGASLAMVRVAQWWFLMIV